MSSPILDTRSYDAPNRRPPVVDEHAFTMVEIIVVLLISVIILGFTITSMRNSRERNGAMSARSVATQLAEGLDQFQRDHGGRIAGQPGTADWNNTWTSPVDSSNTDRSNRPRPYVRAGAVEALATGAVTMRDSQGSAAPNATPAASGEVTYVADTGRNVFAIIAYARRSGTMTPVCFASPQDAATVGSLLPGGGALKPC